MTNIRVLVQYAVPVFTGILGLLWLFGRKKGKKRSNESILDKPRTTCKAEHDNDSRQSKDTKIVVTPSTTDLSEISKIPQISNDSLEKSLKEESFKSARSIKPVVNIIDDENSTTKQENVPDLKDSITEDSDVHVPPIESNKASVSKTTKTNALSEGIKVASAASTVVETSLNNTDARKQTPSSVSADKPVDKETSSPVSTEQIDFLITSPAVVSDTIVQSCNKVESSPVISRKVLTKDTEQFSAKIEDKISNKSDTSVISKHESDGKPNSSPIKSATKNEVSKSSNSNHSDKKDKTQSVDIRLNKASSSLKDNSTKLDVSVEDSIFKEQVCQQQAPKIQVEEDDKGDNSSPPSSESPGCDSNSEASNDSGRGGSVTEQLSAMSPPEIVRYEFNFPSELCGLLIGRHGRNINSIKDESNAMIALEHNPYLSEFQICVVEGTQSDVEKALSIIRQKFPRSKYSQLDMSPINQPVASKLAAPVLMPNIMQLSLPEGVSVDVVVSNIVDAGHIFIQQPTHPSFPSLERLNQFMLLCYTQDQMVPPLPQPIEAGVICVAPLMDGWFRAQVVQVYNDLQECDIKFVDYGGFERVPLSHLKQIRSDFMTLPFQAVECYIATIAPLPEEEYFSIEAANVLDELTQGKVLQAQVVNRAEDLIPCIHLYQISGNRVIFINRELVNRKVVQGIDIVE